MHVGSLRLCVCFFSSVEAVSDFPLWGKKKKQCEDNILGRFGVSFEWRGKRVCFCLPGNMENPSSPRPTVREVNSEKGEHVGEMKHRDSGPRYHHTHARRARLHIHWRHWNTERGGLWETAQEGNKALWNTHGTDGRAGECFNGKGFKNGTANSFRSNNLDLLICKEDVYLSCCLFIFFNLVKFSLTNQLNLLRAKHVSLSS